VTVFGKKVASTEDNEQLTRIRCRVIVNPSIGIDYCKNSLFSCVFFGKVSKMVKLITRKERKGKA